MFLGFGNLSEGKQTGKVNFTKFGKQNQENLEPKKQIGRNKTMENMDFLIKKSSSTITALLLTFGTATCGRSRQSYIGTLICSCFWKMHPSKIGKRGLEMKTLINDVGLSRTSELKNESQNELCCVSRQILACESAV